MNRKESVYFVIGIALTAILFTFVLNGAGPWVSIAQISVLPTNTWTPTPGVTATFTPVAPTATFTPVAPTATFTPVAPTATFTPVAPTATPSNALPIITVDHPLVSVDEGSLAVNGGSAVDPDGRVIDLWANIGSLAFDGSAWQWSYIPSNGPLDQEVTIIATDDSGETGLATFALDVANVAPLVAELVPPSPMVPEAIYEFLTIFTDPAPIDMHVAVVDWADGTACRTGTGSDCSLDEGTGVVGSVTGRHAYAQAGLYTIALSVTDNDGGAGVSTVGPVVVYDPDGGFVTGGGWIDSPPGALAADPSLAGKATFGFVSKYKKGAQVPEGKTEFQFHVADLRFDSTSYDWLVITGGNYARFKGSGTINGNPASNGGDYRFMLWGGDGTGSGGEDTFRIKIWREDTGYVIYDNGMNQAIGGGQIQVHTGK